MSLRSKVWLWVHDMALILFVLDRGWTWRTAVIFVFLLVATSGLFISVDEDFEAR
jgi:hypothetical protein